MSGDPYFSNVTSLLHFDGANGSTTFTDVKGLSYTSAGGAALSTTEPKFGTASLALNGTTQYLEAADNAAFKVGGGSFTIEAWVYLAADPAAGAFAPIASHGNSTADGSYFFAIASGRQLHFSFNSAGTTVAGGTVALNTWTHVAVVQSGSTLTLYANGTSVASGGAPLSGSLAGAFRIGRGRATSSNYFNGRIDEFRIIKGVARYTANFTPPAAAFLDTDGGVPSTVGVVSLMHFDGSNGSQVMTDVLGKTWNVLGNAQISTAQAKFGGSSCYLDGTGDFLASAHPDFGFGAGDWTWEAWVRPDDATGNECLFETRSAPLSGIAIYSSVASASNAWGIANDTAVVATATTLTAGGWTHLAVSKQGTTIRGFKNGVLDFTYTDARTYASSATAVIGNNSTVIQPYRGYIDEMRITKGQARYVADFPVATEAFVDPIDPLWASVTALLHMDGANGSTSFLDETGGAWTAVGNAQISTTRSKFGGASAYFDGTLDEIYTGNNDIAAATTVTLEAWVYLPTSGGGGAIFGQGKNQGSSDQFLNITANRAVEFYKGVNVSGTLLQLFTPNGVVPLDTWTHIALVLTGSQVRIYVAGVLQASASSAVAFWTNTGFAFRIGRHVVQNYESFQFYFTGYIDEVRITKGVERYGSNFTPFPEPFPTGYTVSSGGSTPVTRSFGFVA